MKKSAALFLLLLLTLPSCAGIFRFRNTINEISIIDTSKVHDLDEVSVISRPKESFRLRQQPISSSAFSMKQMNLLSVHDIRDMAMFVPSFSMPNYGSRLTSSIYIRGIGSRVNNPAVAMYIDNMPVLSKSAFNIHTYDISLFEVLRGPQGTLYGQNSEGGLMRLYTINPFDYQGVDARLGVGTHAYRNAELSVFNRVNDKFAFSLSGFYNGQDGFFRNSTLGTHSDKYDEAGGRLRLTFRPSKRWDVNYTADYQYVMQNGFPYGLLDEESGTVSAPSTNRQGSYKRNIFNTVFDLNYLADGFDLNSTTSYQYLGDYMAMDIDYLPQDFMHLTQRQLQNGLTQEFVLKSKRESIWHWTNGIFSSYQWIKTDAPVYFDSDFNSYLASSIENGMKESMITSMMNRHLTREQAEAMIERMGVKVNSVDINKIPGLFHTPQFNLGIYHQSDIDITPRLRATLGLRYAYDHVKIDFVTSASMKLDATVSKVNAANTISSELSNNYGSGFNQLLPKFGISYKLSNNGSNAYLTISKGYRSGGYNIQMFSDILQSELENNSSNASKGDYDVPHTDADYEAIDKTIRYKPETSWNYEAGAHLNLFNGRVHWDIAAFYMQVRNQQLSVMAGNYGFGRRMVNAGKSYSCGIETSLSGSLIDNQFTWMLSYSYTRAVFKEYKDSITVNGEKSLVDYKDKFVPYVPQNKFGIMVDYMIPFKSSVLKSLFFGTNLSMQGKVYWDEANSYSQNFYAILGVHADADFGMIRLSLWGKNITDTHYSTFAVGSAATGTQCYFAQRGNPIQIGFDVKLHF